MVAMIFNPPPYKRGRIEENTDNYAAPDWASGLPEELLDSILAKLVLLSDYVRFSSVCVSWRSSTLRTHNQNRRIESHLSSYYHHKVPLLLHSPHKPEVEVEVEEEKEESNWICNLYSVIDKKLICDSFKFQAPNPKNSRCCGSSHGWLITATSNAYDTISISLVNPFYVGGGRRCCKGIITLPPFDPTPGKPLIFLESSITKVVLSSDPALTLPHDYYLVMVIYGTEGDLAFIKSCDKDWTYVRYGGSAVMDFIGCHDVVYRKNHIYIATLTGGLAICDINKTKNNKCSIRMVARPPPHYKNHVVSIKSYVMESKNDLLLIHRYIRREVEVGEDDYPKYKVKFTTFRFSVYRFLEIGPLKSWVQLNTIGDRVLFLGDNHSICVLCSDFPKGCLKMNSVYFTDDRIVTNQGYCLCNIPEDMGLYSLKDHTVQPYYNGPVSSLLSIPSPIWFLPSIPGKWPC